MRYLFRALSALVCGLFLFISCGDSSSTGWSGTYTDGFALSSVTANSSSSRFAVMAAPFEGDAPRDTKAQALEAIVDATDASSCRVTLPTLGNLTATASCYGPSITASAHPNSGDSGYNASYPTGDLGIWNASESNSTACAAAQLNELFKAVASYIDATLFLEAGAICLLSTSGTAFPAVGGSVDFASDFQTALSVNNSGATVTTATATRTSATVTTYALVGTTDGSKAFNVTVKVSKNSDTDWELRMYGYFTISDKNAFAVTAKLDGTDLKVQMRAGQYLPATADSSIHDSSGNLIYTTSTWNSNMNHIIVNVDTGTNDGNVSYAWQAGTGDSNTRVFNAYTSTSGSTRTGCGFFGFGASFTSGDNTSNTIDGFICDWLNGSHSMSSTTGMAQKQCFTQSSGGIMEENVSKRKIDYAIVDSCNDPGVSLAYSPTPTHQSGEITSHDLTTISGSSDSDFNIYSSPTAPTLSSGI